MTSQQGSNQPLFIVAAHEESTRWVLKDGKMAKFKPVGELYRYKDLVNFFDELRPELVTYYIIRTTPCGFWIARKGKEYWVSNYSRRRFAYPTKEEAMASYKARKKSQYKILKRKVNRLIDMFSREEELKFDPQEDIFEVDDGLLLDTNRHEDYN